MLAGRLAIAVEAAEHALGPGDALEIAPRLPHRVWNPSADDARFLVISAPSTRGDRIDVAIGG